MKILFFNDYHNTRNHPFASYRAKRNKEGNISPKNDYFNYSYTYAALTKCLSVTFSM